MINLAREWMVLRTIFWPAYRSSTSSFWQTSSTKCIAVVTDAYANFIKKPDSSALRLMALLSFTCELIKIIVKNRLTWWCKSKNIMLINSIIERTDPTWTIYQILPRTYRIDSKMINIFRQPLLT